MDSVRAVQAAPQLTVMQTEDFSQFRTAVSDSFVPLNVTRRWNGNFAARIHNLILDDVHVSEISASSHTVERTPALIARGDLPYFKLSLQVSGTGMLVQDNREAVLHPGDLAIYDTNRPYSLVFDDDFRVVVMMFPRQLLDLPATLVGDVTAVRFAGQSGLGGMVAPFIQQLATNLEKCGPLTSTRLANNALDLVSTMITNELDVGRVMEDPHRTLMHQIHSYIESHLGATDLSPARIAAAHYISTRHLHALFREQDSTVSSWIRSRRLEHCRRDFLDPVQADKPVAAIAARWGFVDAAHFSRLFKSTFGQSPSTLRWSNR